MCIIHIRRDDPKYIERVRDLESYFGVESTSLFAEKYVEGTLPNEHWMDCSAVVSQMKNDGIDEDFIESFMSVEELLCDLDRIVDLLLNGMNPIYREHFSYTPVRVIRTGHPQVLSSCNGQATWVSVDQSVLVLFDYAIRLFMIEAFRDSSEEFLIDPPSEQSVLDMFRMIGRSFHRNEWPGNLHPISRMHFRKTININIAASELSWLWFLIGHEFGHISRDHFGKKRSILDFLKSLSAPWLRDETKVLGALNEREADVFGVEVTIGAIQAHNPSNPSVLQQGIFLGLIVMQILEGCVLLEMEESGQGITKDFAGPQGNSTERLKYLQNRFSKKLDSKAIAMIEYLNSAAVSLLSKLKSGSAVNAKENRKRWTQMFFGTHEMLAKRQTDERLIRARQLCNSARYNEALILLESFDNTDEPHIWNLKGEIWNKRGELPEAMMCYQKAVDLDPDSGRPRADLGACKVQAGEIETGIYHLEIATRHSPEDFYVWEWLAIAREKSDGYIPALEVLYRGIECSDIKTGLLLQAAALCANKKKDFSEAIELSQKAIELSPEAPAAWMNNGLYFVFEGKLNQGIASLREAMRLSPKGPSIMFNLAHALIISGKSKEPESLLQEALRLEPGHETGSSALCLLQVRNGEHSKARKTLEEALTLHPNSNLLLKTHKIFNDNQEEIQ